MLKNKNVTHIGLDWLHFTHTVWLLLIFKSFHKAATNHLMGFTKILCKNGFLENESVL